MTEPMTREEIADRTNQNLAYIPGGDPADDAVGAAPASDLSGLDVLKRDLGSVVAKPTLIVHPNEQLSQWTMEFRSVISAKEAEGVDARTQHSKQKIRDRNSIFISSTCIGLYRDGVKQVDGNGGALRFSHKELMDVLGARTAAEAVVKFFANNDGHMAGVADRVAKAAGYGVQVEEADDPTSSA